MREWSRRVFLTLLLLTVAAPAAAWTPRTRMRMAQEAVRLLPASLRIALESHNEPLMRGMLGPMAEEDGPAHRPPWNGGTLDAEVEGRAAALREALAEPGPFSEYARLFGTLAHFVADSGFPPGMGPSGNGRYRHFSEFCESRREKYPLVFYGHQNLPGGEGAYRTFALEMMQRARDEDGRLARAYAAAGDPPSPAAFDDRSVPFAIASLSYSRTVTDIVRVWMSVWNEAGGDMGRVPYAEN